MRKKDDTGQVYEEIEGERVVGDGEGDKRFILEECLSPREIEQSFHADQGASVKISPA